MTFRAHGVLYGLVRREEGYERMMAQGVDDT